MIFQQNSTDLKEMPWFRAVEGFSDAKKPSESKRDDDPDEEVLPRVIEKTILPKITAFAKNVWDPLSTSQTENLTQLCDNVFEKQVLSRRECSQAKQDLINTVVLRMKQSVEEDVFIPLYPKRSNKILISSSSFSDQHCGRQIIAMFKIPRQTVLVSC
uniref:GCF C-terminal domain-containing protein n=1 Tax=Gallus gallus TaxID=9031 RepID=A0A8V0XZ92_CHICK